MAQYENYIRRTTRGAEKKLLENIVWKLKLLIHKAYRRNRKKVLIFTLVLCLLAVGTVAAQIYWNRTITHEINVYGIDAELLVPDVYGYLDKIVATSLTNGKVALVIYAENFYDIWLNITFTSAAQGLNVYAVGQYYKLTQPGPFSFDPDGPTFDIMGYHVIDKTRVMYGNPGGALVVAFTFDTELVTVPGAYQVNLRFEMGFVA